MSSTTLTIDQLELSPFNVRTNTLDSTNTAMLEKSILTRGLILPLVVHPLKGRRKTWGVYAGGRRYRSIKALVERGQLPADWPVDVVIRDLPDAELIAVSAAENLLRRDLRPYEVFAAVARAHRKGDRPEKIAETLGQEPYWVRQSIRLGDMAKPIFDALEAEEISVDQARAYAATEDQALQLSTFAALQPLGDWLKTPAKIRAALKVGDGEAARLLRFVGPDVYRNAGGRFELDLFADGEEERGRIVDEDLLRSLVNDALSGQREDIRTRTGRADLRFAAPPPSGYGGHDYTLQVMPKARPGGGAPGIELPHGDVIAHIQITEAGIPEVSFWWESRKAKFGTGKPGKAPAPRTIATGAAIGRQYDGTKQAIDASIKEEAGLTQEAIQIFRSVRRVIMRGALVEDAARGGDVAIDLLVWSQLRLKLGNASTYQLGVAGLALPENGPESARDHIAATEASRTWGGALYEVQRQSFYTGTDLAAAFLDYRASDMRMKRLAAAIVAGLALERSLNADGYQLPLHDTLAAELQLTDDAAIRRSWAPTTAMLELLPKAQRLAIAEPYVEAATFGPWSRLKGGEVTTLVLEVLKGAATGIRTSMAAAAATWVHPLLSFATPPAPIAAEAELQEAAE